MLILVVRGHFKSLCSGGGWGESVLPLGLGAKKEEWSLIQISMNEVHDPIKYLRHEQRLKVLPLASGLFFVCFICLLFFECSGPPRLGMGMYSEPPKTYTINLKLVAEGRTQVCPY